jgi:hypothetical protein
MMQNYSENNRWWWGGYFKALRPDVKIDLYSRKKIGC